MQYVLSRLIVLVWLAIFGVMFFLALKISGRLAARITQDTWWGKAARIAVCVLIIVIAIYLAYCLCLLVTAVCSGISAALTPQELGG